MLSAIVAMSLGVSGNQAYGQVASLSEEAGTGARTQKDEKTVDLTLDDLKGLSPTDSYMKIHDYTIHANTIGDVKTFLAKETVEASEKGEKKMPPEMEAKMFAFMKSMMNPKVKVVFEKITGNDAVLDAVPLEESPLEKGIEKGVAELANSFREAMGGDKEGSKGDSKADEPKKIVTTGTIYMRLEDGVWKQLKEKWTTKMGDSASESGSEAGADSNSEIGSDSSTEALSPAE